MIMIGVVLRMKPTQYLVIGAKRSGTTLIHLLLKGHPNVSALNDELAVSPFFTQGISTFTYGNDLEEERKLGYLSLFNAISSVLADANCTAFGAKCAIGSQGNAQIIVNVLQKYLKDLKIILVVRNDLVAQYGSLISANKTGIMHSWYNSHAKYEPQKLRINKWLLTRYTISILDTYDTLRQLFATHKVLEISYEEYLLDPAIIQNNLFEFVEVPNIDVTWLKSKKVMPDPANYILNYSSLKHHCDNLRVMHSADAIPSKTILTAKLVNRLYLLINYKARLRAGKRKTLTLARKEGRVPAVKIR